MSEIKLNKELIIALENCKDAKEVMALAKANGMPLSEEKAAQIHEMLGGRALTDEELDMIVGGRSCRTYYDSIGCTCDKEHTYGS